jgi:hydrogenase expression/formation protein HypC
MCLAIPAKILQFTEGEPQMARVAFGAIVQSVCTAYVPEAQVGDYVIVHVGFALSVLDGREAAARLSLLAELGDLDALKPKPEDPQ